MAHRFPVRSLAPLILVAVLSACGKQPEAPKTPTQVAARVNADEITVHQVNQALARAGRIPPEQAKAAARQVLDQLVDQQLMVQKAVEAKLDRSPEVMAKLESARLQILAQAHMDKVLAGAARPDAEAVRQFYESRPELFAERRIYKLQEILAPVPAEKSAALLTLIARTRNLQDIVAFLKANDIRFTTSVAERPAEQLPLEVLPTLAKMRDGEIGALGGSGRFTIVQRVAATAAPMTLAEATPFIEQFLSNRKRNELAGAEIRQLREAAKTEYLGEFIREGGSAAAPAGGPGSAAQAPATPSATSAPSATGANPERPQGIDSAMEKGLRALK